MKDVCIQIIRQLLIFISRAQYSNIEINWITQQIQHRMAYIMNSA